MYPTIITENTVTIFKDRILTATNDHLNYNKIVQRIKDQNWDDIEDLFDVPKAIVLHSEGELEVTENRIYYKGERLRNVVVDKIFAMMSEGFDIMHMVKFLNNLMMNPSDTAIEELYLFLEVCNLPITEDGHFLAYKNVTHDFKDHYTKKMDNSPGSIVEMDRSDVDSDRNRTCSDGLHFAAYDYLDNYYGGDSSRVIILKIHPKDVVAIPKDYHNMKGRACQYLVVGEYNAPKEIKFKSVMNSDNTPQEIKLADGIDLSKTGVSKESYIDNKGQEYNRLGKKMPRRDPKTGRFLKSKS